MNIMNAANALELLNAFLFRIKSVIEFASQLLHPDQYLATYLELAA